MSIHEEQKNFVAAVTAQKQEFLETQVKEEKITRRAGLEELISAVYDAADLYDELVKMEPSENRIVDHFIKSVLAGFQIEINRDGGDKRRTSFTTEPLTKTQKIYYPSYAGESVGEIAKNLIKMYGSTNSVAYPVRKSVIAETSGKTEPHP